MIAMEAPSAGMQSFLFIVAFIAFVLAAILSGLARSYPSLLLCGGLACWMLVLAWTALAAT